MYVTTKDSLSPALSEVCKDWQKEHWCHSYDLETKFIQQNKNPFKLEMLVEVYATVLDE